MAIQENDHGNEQRTRIAVRLATLEVIQAMSLSPYLVRKI